MVWQHLINRTEEFHDNRLCSEVHFVCVCVCCQQWSRARRSTFNNSISSVWHMRFVSPPYIQIGTKNEQTTNRLLLVAAWCRSVYIDKAFSHAVWRTKDLLASNVCSPLYKYNAQRLWWRQTIQLYVRRDHNRSKSSARFSRLVTFPLCTPGQRKRLKLTASTHRHTSHKQVVKYQNTLNTEKRIPYPPGDGKRGLAAHLWSALAWLTTTKQTKIQCHRKYKELGIFLSFFFFQPLCRQKTCVFFNAISAQVLNKTVSWVFVILTFYSLPIHRWGVRP